MMDKYQAEDRGIRIVELEDSFQLCTKKQDYDISDPYRQTAETVCADRCPAGDVVDCCVQTAGDEAGG